jgi:hypothetical protein
MTFPSFVETDREPKLEPKLMMGGLFVQREIDVMVRL